jgi:hypothetical protein
VSPPRLRSNVLHGVLRLSSNYLKETDLCDNFSELDFENLTGVNDSRLQVSHNRLTATHLDTTYLGVVANATGLAEIAGCTLQQEDFHPVARS